MFTSIENPPPAGQPDYFVIDVQVQVLDFKQRWDEVLAHHMACAKDERFRWPFEGWDSVDISRVIAEALVALKQEKDVSMEMGSFAYCDVQATVLYNFHRAREQLDTSKLIAMAIDLAKVAEEFGLALYRHLKHLGFYHNGYFPYSFCGWYGNDILVSLDQDHGGPIQLPESLRLEAYGVGDAANSVY